MSNWLNSKYNWNRKPGKRKGADWVHMRVDCKMAQMLRSHGTPRYLIEELVREKYGDW